MRDAKALLDQVDLSSGTGSQGVQTQGDQQSAPSSGLNLEGLLSGRGGLATGAVAGGLAGLLLGGKRGRRLAGGALKVGGAALIGGLAYKAYQDYQAGKALSVSPSASGTAPVGDPVAALPIKDAARTDFMPSDHNAQEKLSQSLIAAMIGAAKADGHVTEDERGRIAQALSKLTIEGDQRAFIEAELAKPLDVGAIADMASTEEQRVEIYAASLIAVDPQGPAEKGYLAMLAARLGLDPKLVDHLHANADQLLV
jgi:uncharacterized membrane protein YebE (DUF533 family)